MLSKIKQSKGGS